MEFEGVHFYQGDATIANAFETRRFLSFFSFSEISALFHLCLAKVLRAYYFKSFSPRVRNSIDKLVNPSSPYTFNPWKPPFRRIEFLLTEGTDGRSVNRVSVTPRPSPFPKRSEPRPNFCLVSFRSLANNTSPDLSSSSRFPPFFRETAVLKAHTGRLLRHARPASA